MSKLVQEAASKLGADPVILLSGFLQVLRHAVDQLTPDGQVPAAGLSGGCGLGMPAGLAGQLFGEKARAAEFA